MCRALSWCLVVALATQAQVPAPDLRRVRAFILYGLWDEAIGAADDVLARYPGSPDARDARYLRNKARLFKTLALADDDPPLVNAAPMIHELQALTREPLDDAVAAAKLALGTAQYLATTNRRPERLVAEALRDWQRLDAARPLDSSRHPVSRDAIDIRNVVFQPHGRGVFAGDSRFSGVKWTPRSATYLFVRPDLRVNFDPDSPSARVVSYDAFPAHPNVVFMDYERRSMVQRIITTLGTARKRSWMRKGARLDVFSLWMKASFGERGRSGGWLFDTPPRITRIEFVDGERTRAKADVIVRDAGGTVWLEKKNGAWIVTGVRNFWVADR